MEKLSSLIAFATLFGFLAILGWFVREADLVSVIALTVLLVGFDMLRSAWTGRN